MRILCYNWRDIKNPDAGGAEVFTHEVLRRLAIKGHDTTLFTARFSNCLKLEHVDGVRIIREGGKYNVYSKAKKHYANNGCNYDIVIDEINGRPFFTPKFVKDKPILALIHHLSLKAWSLELPFPLGHIGYYYFNRFGLSYYKNVPIVTVSNSSKKDLKKIGLKSVFVVPEGVNVNPLELIAEKEYAPIIAFVGRLKRNKLPDHALKAFSIIKERFPNSRFWIIGDGYMRRKLEKNANSDVRFFGHVEEDLKYRLLSEAHLVLVPAVHEGWGLVITESNAMGTPAIAYNVPGLKDSVINGETGILVEENSPNNLADAAIYLLQDTQRLRRLSENALEFSRQFTWDKTAEIFDSIISKSHESTHKPGNLS